MVDEALVVGTDDGVEVVVVQLVVDVAVDVGELVVDETVLELAV